MTRDTKPVATQEATPESAQGEAGFLQRWSRRKSGEAAPSVAPEGQVEAHEQEAPLLAENVAEAEREAARQREAYLAALPSVESIAATTDVTGFMNAMVPDALRNAALRAAWSADPGIRDFLNDARDYALDYNTPGAAYGYGPLTQSDLAGLDEMVRGIFGDSPKQEPELAGLPEPALSDDDSLVSDCTSATRENCGPEALPADVAPQKMHPVAHAASSVRLSDRAETPAGTPSRTTEIALIPAVAPMVASPGQSPAASRHEALDATASNSDHAAFRRRGGGAVPV